MRPTDLRAGEDAPLELDAAWRLVEHDGAPYFLSTASYRRGR